MRPCVRCPRRRRPGRPPGRRHAARARPGRYGVRRPGQRIPRLPRRLRPARPRPFGWRFRPGWRGRPRTRPARRRPR
ncbi:hypothetical protein E3O55_12075 [Cryobacterium sp. MDB1-18-2]|nr:hypothetical protein E3O55_12075 [Cryobacterium sp. MDB1-18-2]TFC37978.1 hypothetical protein E3O50_17525 [Cryobacterium sp. MDB1-18-1]